MKIKFLKMHGSGNDYVFVDYVRNKVKIKNPSQFSKRISHRHLGIGSDGLIIIHPSKKADFRMQMFNADGSEGEMCGNGIRCIGKYVYEKGFTNKKTLKIETLAGIKILELNVANKKVKSVKVDMGEPHVEFGKSIAIENQVFDFTAVSMGNPHCVIFVENLSDELVNKYGPLIENDSMFPDRTNVEFVKVMDKNNIEMRVWERGSNETMACGTGACAAVVASIANRKTGRKLNVKLLGGVLRIEWDVKTNHVLMTGPVETAFEGEIEI